MFDKLETVEARYEELTKLMIKHNLGVQVKTKIEIKKIDEDFFSEE